MSRRNRILHSTVALAAAAAVLSSCSEDDADASSPAVAASSTQVAAGSSIPSTSEVALPAGVLPLPSPDANDDIAIDQAGRYRIALSDTLALDIDLPQTAVLFGDGLYVKLDDSFLKLETAGETYGVPDDPCHGPHYLTAPRAGVDPLVRAIANQRPYSATQPRTVEVGGADGRYLELRLPPSYDASKCVDAQLGLPGNSGTNNNMAPGYVGDWWIVDVDGQRAVLQAFCEKCDDPTTNRMTRMVRSVTFTPTS